MEITGMLKVEYRKTVDLELLHNNPRTIEDESFDKLCVSIDKNKKYFEARPIILSDRTGLLVVIAGNMRLRAAVSIGLKEVPTVLISGLTEEEEKEIIIRDNVSNGKWDWDMLANEWDANDLNDWGVDIPNWGEEIEEEEEKEKKSVVRLVIEFDGDLADYDNVKERIRNLIEEYPSAKLKE